ncbi:MAG: replication initiation protein [Lachnospiraceae bacterium]|nr:replication initiation protein [Lachnospiraceae bacterium]
MNEIVKYDNYMNSLKFTGFTVTDFNFLIALCSRMRDKSTNKISFSFSELRNLTNYKKSNSIQQFVLDLKHMNEKLMKITCSLETETEIIMFVLFPTFRIDLDNQTLTVCVNKDFKFILNDLIKNFTRFDLNEFIKLDSKYSKTLYRLLKQYKTTGRYETKIDDFRHKMVCPKAYNNKQFMQNVVNPSLTELQNYFTGLQCTVQYAHKRGRPVEGYIFTFEPEQLPKAIQEAEKHKPVNQYQQEEPQYERKQNQFDRFMQRGVSQEELDELERQLLQN